MLEKQVAAKEQRAYRENDDCAELDYELEGSENPGVILLDVLGFAVDFCGVAVRADSRDASAALSGGDEAAGEHLVALCFFNQIRLACQQTLIDLAGAVDNNAVGRNLIAAREKDNVVKDELFLGNLNRFSVAENLCLCFGKNGELVYAPL